MFDSDSRTPDAPWYLIRTHPQEEVRAEHNLRRGNIETFLPLAHKRRRRPAGPAALFPQYFFARFEVATSLHGVSFTRGVQTVVRFGDYLATVDDQVIALFRSRMDANGLIRVGEPPAPGEKVTIEDGPFAALAGVVERQLSDKERVIVLITSAQAAVRVEVPLECIRGTAVGEHTPALV